ncbi:hypothetical protein GCM10027610_138440 [Dactylosporangium cerinum]
MSGMRRTIAIALAAALLFAGGCGRQERKERRDQRPPAVSTQTTPAQDAPAATSQGDDVDQLLDQVDQQLSGDAQPAGDED